MDTHSRFCLRAGQLARELQYCFVELSQIRIDTVIAGAPHGGGLLRLEADHRKIIGGAAVTGYRGKLLANVGGRVLTDNAVTLVNGEDGAQHTLVFRVGLAKVKVRHTT